MPQVLLKSDFTIPPQIEESTPIHRQENRPQLSKRPLGGTPVQSRTVRPPLVLFCLRPANFPDSLLSPLTPSRQSQSSTITAEQPSPTIPSTRSGRSYTETAPQPSRYHKPPQPANTSCPSRTSVPPSSSVVHTQPTTSLTAPNAIILPPPTLASTATPPVTAPSTQPLPNTTSVTNTATMSSTATGF